jgi:hypothetical protein
MRQDSTIRRGFQRIYSLPAPEMGYGPMQFFLPAGLPCYSIFSHLAVIQCLVMNHTEEP